MRQRLLIVNYAMDPDVPIFGHQYSQALELSKYFNYTCVLTDKYRSRIETSNFRIYESNSTSVGKLLRLFKLYKSALIIWRRHRPDVVFYHMTDTHAAALSPLFWLLGLKQVLWYAHAHMPVRLIIALPFMSSILTSTTGSFPKAKIVPKNKISVVGQAISEKDFPLRKNAHVRFQHAVSIGRLDPSKNLHLILRVLRGSSNTQVTEVTFVGASSTTDSNKYFTSILKEHMESRSRIKVNTPGTIRRSDISSFLESYDFFIHAYLGSLDKALLEATLVGIPVVTINSEYLAEMGSWSNTVHPSLEVELQAFFDAKPKEINKKCIERRALCISKHSLEKWALKTATILRAS